MTDDFNLTILIPICVYHSTVDNNFLTYIDNSSSTVDVNGNRINKCNKPPLTPFGNPQWTFAFTFYAVNPLITPFPLGMKLYCAIKNDNYPYNTTEIKLIEDPPTNYNLNGTYFYAYPSPIPETKPLYIHHVSNNIFVNYCPKPPPCVENTYTHEKSKNYTYDYANMSVIYVINFEDFSEKDPNKVKFVCNTGIVQPWNRKLGPVYNINTPEPKNLFETIVECSEISQWKEKTGKPYTLSNILINKLPQTTIIKNKINSWIISIIFCILIVGIFILLYNPKLNY
jgi:hypothetical protein